MNHGAACMRALGSALRLLRAHPALSVAHTRCLFDSIKASALQELDLTRKKLVLQQASLHSAMEIALQHFVRSACQLDATATEEEGDAESHGEATDAAEGVSRQAASGVFCATAGHPFISDPVAACRGAQVAATATSLAAAACCCGPCFSSPRSLLGHHLKPVMYTCHSFRVFVA
jgi:hypothetical protein